MELDAKSCPTLQRTKYILDLVQECFKIVLRKLKKSKRRLLEKKEDCKGEGEKQDLGCAKKGEASWK